MSLLMEMVGLNKPLHTWRQFAAEKAANPEQRRGVGYSGSWLSKNSDKTINAIVNSLSHDEVVTLVAQDWGKLLPDMRMRITATVNERRHTSSASVVKGIQRLDELLGGQVLSTTHTGPTKRKLIEVDGKTVSVNQPVNEAAAAASRAFGAYAKPADYDSWPPARKKKWSQEQAAERRKAKG